MESTTEEIISLLNKAYGKDFKKDEISSILGNHFVSAYNLFKKISEKNKEYELLRWDVPKNQRPEYILFSQFIKRKLFEAKKSKKQFSKEINISRPTIYSYISGESIPQKHLLKKIFLLLAPQKNYNNLDYLLQEEIEYY